MKISQTTTYAIKATLYLLSKDRGKYIKNSDISDTLQIPKIYLFKVMNNLQLSGIIKSKRGALGGYYLIKRAEEITLYDIFKATDSSITPCVCLLHGEDCNGIEVCDIHFAWAEANNQINNILNGFTLQKLKDQILRSTD